MPNQDIELIGTRALILPMLGMTTDQALAIINANHARKALTEADIYLFPMTISNQSLDSYDTRMGASSLNNYRQDFVEGRAVMNSHRAGGYSGAELPIGRSYHANVTGSFLPESADYAAGHGASLDVYAYIQRGIKITDVGTDDLIQAIEGGTIKDVSIGFSTANGGWYRCSVCSGDMGWGGKCPHFPGEEYEEGKAFAWIEDAHAREASLVYKGATPGAFIHKAQRLMAEGKLARSNVLLIEEKWGTRIVDARSFGIGAKGGTEEETVSKGTEIVTSLRGNWDSDISNVRDLNPGLADRLALAQEDKRFGLLVDAYRERASEVEQLRPMAERGAQWLDDLVDQAVKARVRAEGDKFNADTFRKVLRATNDPDYIKGEIKSWETAAQNVLKSGRQVAPDFKALETSTADQGKAEQQAKAPSSAYRG